MYLDFTTHPQHNQVAAAAAAVFTIPADRSTWLLLLLSSLLFAFARPLPALFLSQWLLRETGIEICSPLCPHEKEHARSPPRRQTKMQSDQRQRCQDVQKLYKNESKWVSFGLGNGAYLIIFTCDHWIIIEYILYSPRCVPFTQNTSSLGKPSQPVSLYQHIVLVCQLLSDSDVSGYAFGEVR